MNKDSVDECHMILLYYVPYSTEQKAKEDIVNALKPYLDLKPTDIQIKSKDEKYSAYISVSAQKCNSTLNPAKSLENIKEVKIGDGIANLRRYYYDYQVYINKLPISITEKEVK